MLKGTLFRWADAAQEAFDVVIHHLVVNPVLSMFNPGLSVVVSTDASDYDLGAVPQEHDGDRLKTVVHASRTLSPSERTYSTGEKEALACLWACETWHVYLWGVLLHHVLVTRP